ncbi:type II 3-dehydroquinate dehydratase [Paenarthrobacter sp. NPDC090520]|uniref:type II 3-dehydroquinate dehydratase n=1 Tax=Paenarthrobacter sp. NPDC090520 TaxID=3364382 RepID=UPI0038150406
MQGLRVPNAPQWRIAVIQGPNMSALGKRDPGLFGSVRSLEDLNNQLDGFAAKIDVELRHFSSNIEGEILNFIHDSDDVDAFMINPAGLTMFGMATRDALLDSGRPYLEVHFANLAQWFSTSGTPDAKSIFSHGASGVMEGLRHHGYVGGMLALTLALDDQSFLGKTARTNTHRKES